MPHAPRLVGLVAPSLALAVVLCSPSARAATLTVGVGKTYAKPCDAIAAAQAGDIIAVDAGSYDGDTCAWMTDNLTVRGVGGMAKIDLTNQSPSQKKGIFVVYAPSATIENFELSGAAISASDGNNGAAIRHQGANLTVRNCFFHDNQDGILGGPLVNGQPAPGMGSVDIEDSEFAHNGAGDGYSHNMYIGEYGTFTLRGTWTHQANVGHLVKTRAHENYILYNRITGEDGTDSYEIDVPQGGKTYIIGNLIQQGANSQNPAIITYKEEGPTNPTLELFVVNNSIVNDLGKGTFIHVDASVTMPVVVQNNIFVGVGTLVDQAGAMQVANFSSGDPKFVNQAGFDYHLAAGSPCVDTGQTPGMGDGYALSPDHEYVQPSTIEARAIVSKIDIGAYELGGGSGAGGAGAGGGKPSSGSGGGAATSGSSSSGGLGGAGHGGAAGNGGGGAGTGGSGSGAKSGCSFQAGSSEPGTGGLAALVLAGVMAARRRRARG